MVANYLKALYLALISYVLYCGAAPTALALALVQPELPAGYVQLLADTSYYPALLGKITTAEKSIDLVMYLWKLADDGGGKPADLAKALGEAKQRGVDVRVILENSEHDASLNRANRKTADLLRRAGISTFFDSSEVTTHTKLAIIDQRFCLVGSHNLTKSALERNHEISLLLDNPRLAGELTNYVEKLLKNH